MAQPQRQPAVVPAAVFAAVPDAKTGHGRSGLRMRSKARATPSTCRSAKRWPAICSHIGRPPAVKPQGMLMAGC